MLVSNRAYLYVYMYKIDEIIGTSTVPEILGAYNNYVEQNVHVQYIWVQILL